MARDNNVFHHYYAVLEPYLSPEGVTDFFINSADSVYQATITGIHKIQDEKIDAGFIEGLAKVVASQSDKSNRLPIISSAFPTGERIELIQQPAVKQTCFAIRKPTSKIFTIEDLDAQGIFDDALINPKKEDTARLLSEQFLKADMPVAEILKKAVEGRLNIIISGATGSAKTTLSKALIQYIPKDERLITLEDAEELTTPDHDNSVHFFYPREKSDGAISATTLLLSCLRFKPDRILLAEVRGEEAYDFLDSVNTGHPGSITTIHATSHLTAIDRMAQMIRHSPAARNLSAEDIRESVINQVDLFLHMENRRLKTVYFPRAEYA